MPNPNKRPNRGASSAGILRATSNTADLLASSLNNTGLRRKMSDPEARISRGGTVLNFTFWRLYSKQQLLLFYLCTRIWSLFIAKNQQTLFILYFEMQVLFYTGNFLFQSPLRRSRWEFPRTRAVSRLKTESSHHPEVSSTVCLCNEGA